MREASPWLSLPALESHLSLNSQQAKLVRMICQHIVERPLSYRSLIRFLLYFHFTLQQIASFTQYLSRFYPGKISHLVPEEDTWKTPGPLLNKYYKHILHLFFHDLLFLVELEKEVKRKSARHQNRFEFFFSEIPHLIEVEIPQDVDTLLHKHILILLRNNIYKLIIHPLRQIIHYPGQMKLNEFTKIVFLSGRALRNVLDSIEKNGFVDVNYNTGHITFLVNRINRNPNAYHEVVKRATRGFDSPETTILAMVRAYKRSTSMPRNHFCYHLYQKISQGNIKLHYEDLRYRENLSEAAPKDIYKEVYNLFGFFIDPSKQSWMKDTRMEIYIDALAQRITRTLEASHLKKQRIYLYKSLALLSFLPGVSIKINHFFKKHDRNSYDLYRKRVSEVYF